MTDKHWLKIGEIKLYSYKKLYKYEKRIYHAKEFNAIACIFLR